MLVGCATTSATHGILLSLSTVRLGLKAGLLTARPMQTKPSLLNRFMALLEICMGVEAVEASGLELAGAKAAACSRQQKTQLQPQLSRCAACCHTVHSCTLRDCQRSVAHTCMPHCDDRGKRQSWWSISAVTLSSTDNHWH